MLLEAQGKTAAAREKFEHALQLDSTAPVAANNLAWIYAQSDAKLDAALELAQTAKRTLRDAPEVADTLGFIYYKKGLFPEAVHELGSAVSGDDTNPTFHYHLGLALVKTGNKTDAAKHLSRALTLKPGFEGSADAKAILGTLGS
jgi:Flp pilus assembly protein TadD